jgi:hypothetical protein
MRELVRGDSVNNSRDREFNGKKVTDVKLSKNRVDFMLLWQ